MDVAGKKRKIANIIFYDRDLNILVQERGSHSKSGEIYGFWGGGIEQGETPEKAIRRELNEELSYRPKRLDYWGNYSFKIDAPGSKYHGAVLRSDLFIAPITKELLNSKPEEGSGIVIMPIDRAIENKDREFGPITTDFLIKVKQYIIGKLQD